jgi:hypothetical protein
MKGSGCMRLVESPRGDVQGRQRSIVAVSTTVSAAPAERNMPSSVGSRLKHIVRAEVFTDRPGARVSLRLPRTAG